MLTASAATLALPRIALAAYPDKPIKIIVPWAPGGSTDAIARALAQSMSEGLKQSVIVDNRAGAGGQIGTDFAAKSPADGYTLSIVELPHAIAPAVVAKVPYDLLRDFSPISLIGTSPMILFANSSANDLKGFVKSSTPSLPSAIAHSGSGTSSHLVGELFAKATKTKFTMVPYRGSAPALTDVAAGIVAGHFATLASGASLMSAGKIKPLAVTSRRRMDTPSMRNVPTMAELGFKDFEVNQWWALVAPSTTSIDTLEMVRTQTLKSLSDPKVFERLSTLGIDLKGSSRDATRAFMRAESERWQAVAKGIGLQPQ
ncbi:tripartite tricarboxylate transporter substrate binding protein [Variovorax sp. PCZ-1]|nr:tripartite tricarboxylate transporter substrate binding protein [Variovorax sp. PCZ-1]